MLCARRVSPPDTRHAKGEFISYKNPDGASKSRVGIERDMRARAALVDGDVLVGSAVAIKREEIEFAVPGYDTPFYIGGETSARKGARVAVAIAGRGSSTEDGAQTM